MVGRDSIEPDRVVIDVAGRVGGETAGDEDVGVEVRSEGIDPGKEASRRPGDPEDGPADSGSVEEIARKHGMEDRLPVGDASAGGLGLPVAREGPGLNERASVPGEPAPIVDARPGSDPDDKRRYAEDDSKIMHSGQFPNLILLGDSSTSGWDLNESFAGRNFVNRGIAGQATNQILARFQQDVGALHPKAVAILARW